MAVQKAQQEVPDPSRQRQGEHHSRRQPSDDECRRRHDAALLGAELAPQSVGLQGRHRDDEEVRRVAPPERIDVEDWPFGLEELEQYYDKVEYELGVSGQAGNIKGAIDPKGKHFRRRATPRLPDAAAAQAPASST
jgi:hypothetical protein